MTAKRRVGVAATTAPWSANLRAYLRDHTQGISVQVVMDRASLFKLVATLDVLIVDDVMGLLSAPDVTSISEAGVTIIGLYDPLAGRGRQYLATLGVATLLDANVLPSDLVAALEQAPARERPALGLEDWGRWPQASVSIPEKNSSAGRGLITVWTKVSGGCGLTEAVISAAEHLARTSRVLVIELDEVAPILVSRLLRSPDSGLAWALARAAVGKPVVPEGLSGARGDGVAPLGGFDAICASQGPSHVVNAAHVPKLLAQVEDQYDHILIEACWLVGAPAERERFSATRAVMVRADRVVVVASGDPEGAARLVEWRAAALAAGVTASCWATFGRAGPSRYEREHLVSLVRSSTGAYPFTSFAFLPEDPVVRRARWNGELVKSCAWARAVQSLVAMTSTNATAHPRRGTRRARFWRSKDRKVAHVTKQAPVAVARARARR